MAAIRTALQIGCFGDYSGSLTGYGLNALPLDATGKELAGGYIADSTDAITHVGVRVGGTVASPPIYRVSLQGMGSTGLPNGTILGGGSPASATFNGSGWSVNTFHWIALDNPYTPTVGQIILPTLDYSSGTIGASNRISFIQGWTNFIASTRLQGLYTTANWGNVNRTGRPAIAVRTANTRFGLPIVGTAPTQVQLGTAGHRDALKFTLPEFFSTITCYGFRVTCKPPNTTFKLGIWDSSGTEVAAETIDNATLSGIGDSYITCGFSAPVTLSPSVAYYAGIERTGGTACGLVHAELSEANDQLAFPLGTAACRATWNGSAWSDNTTFRPLSLELLISDITGGGGGAAFQLVGGGGLVY